MTFPLGINLSVLAGPKLAPLPLSGGLTALLIEAEVHEVADGQATFRLTFGAQRMAQGLGPEVAVIADGSLAVGNRVVLSVLDGILPVPIVDGLVTDLWLDPAVKPADARIVVSGTDLSVAMDLKEAIKPWPDMDEALIVAALIATYAEYGIVPEIVPPVLSELPILLDRTPVQRSTDLDYLYGLADRFGYDFTVRPGPVPLTNVAYWGPPKRVGLPAPALTIGDSTFSNVDSLTFSRAGRAAFTVAGLLPGATEVDPAVLVAALVPDLVPPLTLDSPYLGGALVGRRLPKGSDGLSEIRAEAASQGRVNRASSRVARAHGSLDVSRYGAILRAGGLVGVRGAGASYDGVWSVEQVTHRLRRKRYAQSFALARDGTLPLAPLVPP